MTYAIECDDFLCVMNFCVYPLSSLPSPTSYTPHLIISLIPTSPIFFLHRSMIYSVLPRVLGGVGGVGVDPPPPSIY